MSKLLVDPKIKEMYDEEIQKLPTTSSKIRFLAASGMKRADVARYLEIRYQHVRNVLITPLKRDQS